MKTAFNIEQTKFLVTGGSGSLGRSIIKYLLKKGAKHITSISRDEDLIKQAEIEIGPSPVQFKLGDITDTNLVSRLMKDVDVVFNTAAIKHVSLAEKNPREAHRINITGLLNLLDNSQNVERFIHISSDKAIGVINCYGATKLLGEYLVRESNELYKNCKYIIMRCPNILGSRGSVLEIWKQQVARNGEVTITDSEMTRYFITPQDAAKFIVDVGLGEDITSSKIYYPLEYTHKFLLKDLARAFIELLGKSKVSLKVIGAMPGEKKHEDYIEDVELSSKEELKNFLSNLSP
ncbi:MAG: SDR family NAD(P)-dependent oxidoreductase [Candidatus Daviesbacteria bacterium]|nr:SDR family NAD(P)-dependent oxidoreductase [Candidatus Daviesbacteria bacterium]